MAGGCGADLYKQVRCPRKSSVLNSKPKRRRWIKYYGEDNAFINGEIAMTEEQGDKIIELLDAISDKLSDALNKQDRLEELLEPWQDALDNIAGNTDGENGRLGDIKTDIQFITKVAHELGKKYLNMI
jgi:hypothetical protein